MLSNTRLNRLLASCRIVILSVVLGSVSAATADDDSSLQLKGPYTFPNISYTDANGQPHVLKDDLGKLTIVHFWATWCAPCVKELPQVDAMQRSYAADGLKVIDISEDGSNKMAMIKDFFAKNSITSMAPYLDGGSNDSFRAAHGRGLPTSYFLDSKGHRIGIAEGPIDWQSKAVQSFIELRLHTQQ